MGGVYFTKDQSEAQVFTTEVEARRRLQDAIMNTSRRDFEVVEFGLVPVRVAPVTLTDDMHYDHMARESMHDTRAVHRNTRTDEYEYYISYLGYEYAPSGVTKFNLKRAYRSRGKEKLRITCAGKHFDISYHHRRKPSSIFVHGLVGGKKTVEEWRRRSATRKRKPTTRSRRRRW